VRASDVDVLLAEDNASDAELILHSLEEQMAGRIHVVHDGEEALDFLFGRGSYAARGSARPPKLVMLDVKLPKVDGLQVLRELRAHRRTWALPVVLLTSSNVVRDVVEGYRLGANSYVQKPVDFVHFRQMVRRLGRYWLAVNEPVPAQAYEAEDA
jgi:two-component system, response regulator